MLYFEKFYDTVSFLNTHPKFIIILKHSLINLATKNFFYYEDCGKIRFIKFWPFFL